MLHISQLWRGDFIVLIKLQKIYRKFCTIKDYDLTQSLAKNLNFKFPYPTKIPPALTCGIPAPALVLKLSYLLIAVYLLMIILLNNTILIKISKDGHANKL